MSNAFLSDVGINFNGEAIRRSFVNSSIEAQHFGPLVELKGQ